MVSPATRSRAVPANIGVVAGGIGVNWRYVGVERSQFGLFLNELISRMGFLSPSTVYLTRNGEEGRIDWNRLRISSEECELHGVSPEAAVIRGREWLLSSEMVQKYGVRFSLPTRRHR